MVSQGFIFVMVRDAFKATSSVDEKEFRLVDQGPD